jgi:hypothetical protein
VHYDSWQKAQSMVYYNYRNARDWKTKSLVNKKLRRSLLWQTIL